MIMMMIIQTTEVLLLVEVVIVAEIVAEIVVEIVVEIVEISLIGVVSNSSLRIWIMPFQWTRPSLDSH